jgi:hypothetical protein
VARSFFNGRRTTGLSLIELALVMVIVTLALVPVIRMIGGPNSSEGKGNATRVIGLKSKEILLANSLVERALSSDLQVFNCGNAFNPVTNLPGVGQSADFPAGGRCTDNTYNQPLYYQWTVRNMDPSGTEMPMGNHYYTSVLNVWDTATGGTPIMTLPTFLFWNESAFQTTSNSTGIIVVLDSSGSMSAGQVETAFAPRGLGNSASPFLKYRYADPDIGYNPPASIALNINNNAQLDVVSALNADDPDTPWDDRYIKPGILGFPVGPPSCSTSMANWNAVGNVWQSPPFFAFDDNDDRDRTRAICALTGMPIDLVWQTTMNWYFSRIEAARSSLISFLISMEADPSLYQNTKLGFVTFSTDVVDRVVNPIESVDGNNRYPQMRRWFTWINRQGGSRMIPATGSTNMYGALRRGAQVAFSDSTLDNRIIFLVGDGAPMVAPTSHAAFQTLSTQIGNGTFPGANGKTATVFTLGLLSSDPDLPEYLRDDIALRTPGGEFFYAQSIGDVDPIFNQIKYQIQRVILLNKSNRFNVDFS